jgi:soluble cytochrome b562
MDSAAIASKAAESAEAATRIGDATVSSTTSPAVQSIQDIADKFAKNLGVFGKDNASNSEILDEFNRFGHTADHLPGSPQASDAALQARVANGANAATRFTSLETAADAARQVPKAILERAAKDPQFADQLENFLNGGQKAVGTVFDTGKSVGEGFIKAPNGSIQQIDNLSKVYVRLQWSGGKAGAGSIKIFTLYPKAPGMPSLASPVVEDAGRAAETGEAGLLDFLRGGKPVEESSIPKDASNFHKLDDTHYSFVRNGQIHVRSGENYTVRNGDFLDFKRDALLNGETALKTIAGRNVAVFGIKDQKEADLIFQILEDSPIPDSLDHAKNIFVVDHIGHGTTPDWKPNGTYIAGLAGNNQGEIVVSREALRNLDSTKDVLYHEMGHNLDVTFGGGRSYGISSAPESPFGTGTVVSDYARTNPAEDFAETHRMVLTLLKNGLDNKGNAYYYLSRVRDLWLQAKYNAVLQPYGIRIPYLE